MNALGKASFPIAIYSSSLYTHCRAKGSVTRRCLLGLKPKTCVTVPAWFVKIIVCERIGLSGGVPSSPGVGVNSVRDREQCLGTVSPRGGSRACVSTARGVFPLAHIHTRAHTDVSHERILTILRRRSTEGIQSASVPWHCSAVSLSLTHSTLKTLPCSREI